MSRRSDRKLTGFGLGFRPPHYRIVTETLPRSVDWFEIITENFLSQPPRGPGVS